MKHVIANLFAILTLTIIGLPPSTILAQRTDPERLSELNTLLSNAIDQTKEKTPFITPYLLDSLITGYQKSLSGSQVEAGKLIGSSISITDKGATANIGVKRFCNMYSQLAITGQGKDNLINLFDKGTYGNNIGVGVKLQFFQKSSGFFWRKNANILHSDLLILQTAKGQYQSGTGATQAYDTKLTYIYSQIQNLVAHVEDYDNILDQVQTNNTVRSNAQLYRIAADTLEKLGLLPEGFLSERNKSNRDNQANALSSKWSSATAGAGPDAARLRYYLSEAESLQMKANWNVLRFKWWTIGVNYNVSPYKILDSTVKKDDYQRTDNDYYFTASGSWNLLWARQAGKQRRFFISPTVSISGARVYKEEDKMNLERLKQYTIGTDTLLQKSLTADVYRNVADRQFAASFETPLTWYWYKSHFGLEVSPKVGFNDSKGDNIGLRLGVFIPAEIKDGTPIIIQPFFRLQKLFESGSAVFWKDNVSVGFNISVSLPKAMGKL